MENSAALPVLPAIDESGIPEQIRCSGLYQDILDRFPENLDRTDKDLVSSWVRKKYYHYTHNVCDNMFGEDGEEFDIVEKLGGEEETKEWIANSWSLVTIPASQIRLIGLFKEAGFVVVDTPRSSGDDPTATATVDTAGGDDTGERSNSNSTAGGGYDNDSFAPGNSVSNARAGEICTGFDSLTKPIKPKKMKLLGMARRKPAYAKATAEIMIINQRGQLPHDSHDYVCMDINDQTSMYDVKEKVHSAWRVSHGNQFLWSQDTPGELPQDNSRRLIQDLSMDSDTVLCLRHETKKGTLKTNQSELPARWPVAKFFESQGYRTPWNLGIFEYVTVWGESLFDSANVEDKRFAPQFAMDISPEYQYRTRDDYVLTLPISLSFSVHQDIAVDVPTHRGYFVERFEIEFKIPGVRTFRESTDGTTEEMQLSNSGAVHEKNTIGATFGVSATTIVDASVEAGIETGKQRTHGDSSQVSSAWNITTKETGWVISKKTWDNLHGYSMMLYPSFNASTGKIPALCHFYKGSFFGSWVPDENQRHIYLPDLGALWRGDGEHGDRNAKSKIGVKVTMMLRKVNTRSPTKRYLEYSDSYRQVVVEGDIQLAEFPERIVSCKSIMLWVVLPLLVAIFAMVLGLPLGITFEPKVEIPL